MIPLLLGFINAGMCAWNVSTYASTGSEISLGAAVFSGLVAMFCWIVAAVS